MRVWNVSEKEIKQFYNNQVVVIAGNTVVEVGDDLAVFLLNKKEVRGWGLVQLKDGDKKEERYAQGRKQIYDWAQEKYADYEKHCEEREEIKGRALKPHQAILDYQKTIEQYDEWVASGSKVKEEFKEVVGEKRVFACPYCNKEFSERIAYFGHLRSHQKEEKDVNTSPTKNKSEGEG